MSYQAFPIYDFKSGLRLNREPIALPNDAFTVFKNAYIENGSIVKRKGLKDIAHVTKKNQNEDTGAIGDGSSQVFTFHLQNIPIKKNSVIIWAKTTTGNNEVFNDDGEGNLSSGQGGVGTIHYDDGEIMIMFINPVANGEHVWATYEQLVEKTIVGFGSLRDESNNVFNYIFDTENVYLLDIDNEKLIFIASFLHGDKHDYVQCEKWRYRLFGTNNKDRPFWMKGNNWGFIDVDFDGDNNNDIDRCSLILEFKERLLLFSTTEKGTACPQRIRWCKPNNPFDWTNDEYLDIPTSEIIISAQKLNDKIIVWCSNSVWTLLYTANPDMPFIVKCIAREIKTFGRMSAVVVEDKIFNISDTGIIVTDGVSFERIDVLIPRFFDETNRSKRNAIFGYHYKPLNQIWWAYCSINSDEKDNILYFDYLNQYWGVYTIKTNILGEIIAKNNAPTWDNIDESWDDINWTWDESTFQDELLMTLFGNYEGKVSLGLIGYKDGEDNQINFEIESVNLNSLWRQNIKRSSLGWIDFYVKCENSFFNVEFYKDNNLSPLLVVPVDLAGDKEQKLTRVKYGARAECHKIKIKNNKEGNIKFYGIIPYLKILGRSRTR